jgi:uncharacterized membrane protein
VVKPVLSTVWLVLTALNDQPGYCSLLGLGMAKMIKVKDINIFAPVDEVYCFWRDLRIPGSWITSRNLGPRDVSTWKGPGLPTS